MKNYIDYIAENIEELQERQDGTLKGGYLSITEGRFRIVLGSDVQGVFVEGHWDNVSCKGKKNNVGCTNKECTDSTNNQGLGSTCTNYTCLVSPIGLSTLNNHDNG
jgi:hypothetical protein